MFLDDFRDHIGILAVGTSVSTNHYGLRAKFLGHFHGHAGMYTKTTGLVAAGRHYATVAGTTHQ